MSGGLSLGDKAAGDVKLKCGILLVARLKKQWIYTSSPHAVYDIQEDNLILLTTLESQFDSLYVFRTGHCDIMYMLCKPTKCTLFKLIF